MKINLKNEAYAMLVNVIIIVLISVLLQLLIVSNLILYIEIAVFITATFSIVIYKKHYVKSNFPWHIHIGFQNISIIVIAIIASSLKKSQIADITPWYMEEMGIYNLIMFANILGIIALQIIISIIWLVFEHIKKSSIDK